MEQIERWNFVTLGMQPCSILPDIRNRSRVSWVHQKELSIRYGGRAISQIGFDGTDKLAEKREKPTDFENEIETQHLQEQTEAEQLREVIAKLRTYGRYFSVTPERNGVFHDLVEFDKNGKQIGGFNGNHILEYLQGCLDRKENEGKGENDDDDGYPDL